MCSDARSIAHLIVKIPSESAHLIRKFTMKRCLRAYGSALGNGLYGKGPVVLVEDVQERAEKLYPGKWEAIKLKQFKNAIPDDKLSPEHLARLSRLLDAQEKKLQAEQAERDLQELQSDQVA